MDKQSPYTFWLCSHKTRAIVKWRTGPLSASKKKLKPSLRIKLYTCRALKDILSLYAVSIIAIKGAKHYYIFMSSIVTALGAVFSDVPSLASYIIILSQKRAK